MGLEWEFPKSLPSLPNQQILPQVGHTEAATLDSTYEGFDRIVTVPEVTLGLLRFQ